MGLPRYRHAMRVRMEEQGDGAAVARVITDAFGDDGLTARLAAALGGLVAAGGGSSLVAELDGQIVGHVMFTRSLLDAPSQLVDVRVLGPLAVATAHQRHGIGGALVMAGLELMRGLRVPIVFLEGSPTYYPRFGFTPGTEQGFRKPSLRIPDAAFMAMRLESSEPWMTGTLVYAHEFWDFDAVGLRDAPG
jgi:putative acetyltransferase